MSATLAPGWPMVGRRVALDEALDLLLDPARGGVVLHGPPGVGKTRLADELAERAAVAGLRVSRAVASTTTAQVPLGALAHLLPPEVLLTGRGDDALDVVRLLAAARQALAGEGRHVLVVDDAHLLDVASLTLLTQLVGDGAALVATVRAGETEPDGLVALWRSGRLERMELAALSEDDVDTVLHLALGAPVDGWTLHVLRTRSAGNPLFLRELVRAAADSGALRPVDGVWRLTGELPPATRLGDLVAHRLGGLAPAAREVLELLALAGPTPLELLPPVDPLVLAELEESGRVELRPGERSGDPEVVALAHPLIGEALRAAVPRLRARAALAAHAERVERRPDPHPEDPLRIATWRIEAGLPADPDVVLRAAEIARHAEDFTRTEALVRVAHTARPTGRTGLLLGECLYELGRFDECERVLVDASGITDDPAVAAVISAVRATNLLFGLLRPADALAEVHRALADLPDEPHLVGARDELTSRVALLEMYGGDPAAALRTLAPLDPDSFRAGEDERLQRRARVLWAIPVAPALALGGRTGEARRVAERALVEHDDLEEEIGYSRSGVHVLTLALALSEHGDLEDARKLASAGFDATVAAGSPLGQVWFALMLGRIALHAGTPRTGLRWFREAVAVATAIGFLGPRRQALAGEAVTSAWLGDLDGAAEALARHDAEPGEFGFMFPERALGRAAWLAGQGRIPDARAALADAADAAGRTGHLTVRAWLLHEMARLGGAADVVDELEALAATADGRLVAARAGHVRALVDRDVDALTAAAADLAGLGAWLVAAEAYAAAADAARRAGDQRRANALAGESAAVAERCEGAVSPLLVAAPSVVPLSPREREVAALAARGTPSKEIAERLYLSVRTVNNHLQNVYTKLGVSSRAELAAALDRIGPG